MTRLAQRAATAVPRLVQDGYRGFGATFRAALVGFALAVRDAQSPGVGGVDPRLILAQPSNVHQESFSAEGYMVPPQIAEDLWRLAFEEEDLLSLLDLESASRNVFESAKDESTPWGPSTVKVTWKPEAVKLDPTKASLSAELVKLCSLKAFVEATEELLEDSAQLARYLGPLSARAIAWSASEAAMNGSGVYEPLGWTKAPATIVVAKETSQTADTIVEENIVNMFGRVLDPGRSIWFANQDCIPQLAALPQWSPTSDLSSASAAVVGFLCGRPVRVTEHCPTLGDEGDLQLVSPRGYLAAVKEGPNRGVRFASSMHLHFDYALTAFRWTFRFNGQPRLSAPVDPANGSVTKSHFIVLGERA